MGRRRSSCTSAATAGVSSSSPSPPLSTPSLVALLLSSFRLPRGRQGNWQSPPPAQEGTLITQLAKGTGATFSLVLRMRVPPAQMKARFVPGGHRSQEAPASFVRTARIVGRRGRERGRPSDWECRSVQAPLVAPKKTQAEQPCAFSFPCSPSHPQMRNGIDEHDRKPKESYVRRPPLPCAPVSSSRS
jgi:hypothetical protein